MAGIVLSLTASLLLMIPSVQTRVVKYATSMISEKTGMKTEIRSVNIGFLKTVQIEGLFLRDLQGDTLIYLEKLHINAGLFGLLRKKINIDYLLIDGLKGNLIQRYGESTLNITPMFRAFEGSGNKKKAENPWALRFSEIELKNVRGGIESEADSSYMRLNIGYLHILASKADIARKEFNLESITIDNTSFFVKTKRSMPDTIETEQNNEQKPIPFSVSLGNLAMSGIRFGLETGNEKVNIQVKFNKASIIPKEIDLNKFLITASDFRLDSADVYLAVYPSSDSMVAEVEQDSLLTTPYTFADIPWVFAVDHAEIMNTAYQMDIGPDTADIRGMDYLHMTFRDFNFVADSLFFNKNTTGAMVSSLSVTEATGGTVRGLKGKFFMDNTRISAENVEMKTLKSWMAGNALLTYPALRLIGRRIEELTIDTDFRGRVFVAESRPFTDVLERFPMLQHVQFIDVAKLSTEGPLKSFKIHDIDATADKLTKLKLHGNVNGLPYDTLGISYSIDTFYTTREAIERIITGTLLPRSIVLPQWFGLRSAGSSGPDGSKAEMVLLTDAGKLHADLSMKNEQFFSEISGRGIDLGYILSDSTYGLMAFDSEVEGIMVENSWPDMKVSTNLLRIETDGNAIEDLYIVVDKVADEYRLKAQLKDSAFKATMKGLLVLGDSAKSLDANMTIKNIDLHALGLVDDEFKIAGEVSLNIAGKSLEEYTGSISAGQVSLLYDKRPYHLAEIALTAKVGDGEKNYRLTSDVLDASLSGNVRIMEVENSISDHLSHYITLPDSVLSHRDYHYRFDLNLRKPDFLAGFLFEDLKEFSLERCRGWFDSYKSLFDVEISLPVIRYADIRSENLLVDISSSADSMDVFMRIGSLNYDSSFIRNIELKSTIAHQNGKLSFKIHDIENRLKYGARIDFNYEDSTYFVHMVPEELIIHYEPWEIPRDNNLIFNKNSILARSATLSRGRQRVWLDADEKRLILNFGNFDIRNITGLPERDSLTTIFAGNLYGKIVLDDPFGKLSLSSNLIIPELLYGDVSLGELSSALTYKKDDKAKAGLSLKHDDNSIVLSGSIDLSTASQPLSVIMEADIENANIFMPLFSESLDYLNGKLTGRMAVSGTVDRPNLDGRFQFDDLAFNINATGTFLRNNGQVVIEDNLAEFNDFVIRDSLGNELFVDGSVDLTKLANPLYDLRLVSGNFMVVNNHDVKNETVIGRLAMGIDAEIKSMEDHLQVNANLRVNKETDITYIMPGQELELISDAGIVEITGFGFEEFETDDAGKKQFIGDSIISLFGNIHLAMDLEVDPEARFTVHLDPNSGDFSEFRLKGKLHYLYDDIRKGKLTGILEFEEGFYELSFYRLVKKRFTFDPGSTVTWSGDVMDGVMDFSARYTVRSNSVGLISNEISSYERSMYNQRLPYDVILKVTNKISEPEISFWIDLPQRHRANYPVIDAKLSMLSQPFMEAERNKQVFALLVAGTFIPEDPGTDASSSRTFATTAAVNSVNAIMTEQLNNLTGRFIKVVDIDMGVNTFEEYGSNSAQMRTQLDLKVSKNLFDDRVSVEVDSHINIDGTTNKPGTQSTAGMTEFAVSYKITKSGNYRVKAFSENAYDIYDGEIQISGLAFIFVREFDGPGKRRRTRPPSLENSQKSIEN